MIPKLPFFFYPNRKTALSNKHVVLNIAFKCGKRSKVLQCENVFAHGSVWDIDLFLKISALLKVVTLVWISNRSPTLVVTLLFYEAQLLFWRRSEAVVAAMRGHPWLTRRLKRRSSVLPVSPHTLKGTVWGHLSASRYWYDISQVNSVFLGVFLKLRSVAQLGCAKSSDIGRARMKLAASQRGASTFSFFFSGLLFGHLFN